MDNTVVLVANESTVSLYNETMAILKRTNLNF